MPPIQKLGQFAQDETGAITVDWVVLTAAIVLLAGGAAMVAMPGIGQLALKIGDNTRELQVGFDKLGAPPDAPESEPEAPLAPQRLTRLP
jgi:hypothetical protein